MFNSAPFNSTPYNTAAGGGGEPAYQPSWPLSLEVAPLTVEPSWPLSLRVRQTLSPSWSLKLQVSSPAALLSAAEHGWSLAVRIAGADVSARLTGPASVVAEEGMAAIATFRIRPAAGAIDPAAYIGQEAALDYVWRDVDGDNAQTAPLWSGRIDTVAIDPRTFVLTLTGIDRRADILAAGGASLLPGTRWSVGVFDAGGDALAQQEDRLSTVCSSFDLSPDGSPALTPWAPDGPTAALIVQAADYLDGSLSLSIARHDDLVQQVGIEFDYRFSRLRLREYRMIYTGGAPVDFAEHSISPPSVSMIEEAIAATDLIPFEVPYYETMPDQWFEYAGTWYNYPGYEGLALYASAILGRRWAQSIEYHYTLTVACAGSGIDPRRVRDIRGALENAFDATAWEANPDATPVLDRPYLRTETLIDATADVETGIAEAENAVETLLAQAQRTLRASHRNNHVSFGMRLNPYLSRAHRVSFNAAGVVAHGKVYRIEHQMDPDAGPGSLGAKTLVTLAISRPSLVNPTPTALDAPAAPAAPVISTDIAQSCRITLGNQIGGLADSPAYSDSLQGYLINIPSDSSVDGMTTSWGYGSMVGGGLLGGNYFAPSNLYPTTQATAGTSYYSGQVINPDFNAATAYPAQFRIIVPDIEPAARDNLETSISADYLITIPADTFTLTAT